MATSIRSANSLGAQLNRKTATRRSQLGGEVRADAAASAPRRNDLRPGMAVTERPISSLATAERRARKISAQQLERVMASIRRFGIVAPVLIRSSGAIIDGHIVVEAASKLAMASVPCIDISHLDEAECRALRIALNRIAETGEWDLGELRIELTELIKLEVDILSVGFSAPELDIIMIEPSEIQPERDELPDLPAEPISRLGDVWQLGPHRLICGNALDPVSYRMLLQDRRVQAVFSDAPYNIPIAGFVSGMGKTKHEDFAMGVGEMSEAEFGAFLETYLRRCAEVLDEGGVLYACMDWRSNHHLVSAGERAGLNLYNMAVWNKGSGGMGSLYRSAHELIPVFVNGAKLRVNNVELGRHGRDRTNVWSYPGANRRGSSAGKALASHPTPKPVEMVRDAFLDVTKRGETVLDPFMGSGTSLIAAEECGRTAYGIELDPAYVDVIIRRWEASSGSKAVHVECGLGLEALAEQRSTGNGAPA